MSGQISDAIRINPRKLWTGAFVPNWLLEHSEVGPGAKLCYARLCQYYSEDTGYAWPSQGTLAHDLGVTDRQTRTYVSQLEKHKLLEVEQIGLRRSNRYYFLWHPWMSASGLDRNKTSGQERTETSVLDRTLSSGPVVRESVVRESSEENQKDLTTSASTPSKTVVYAPHGFDVPRELVEQWITAYPAINVLLEISKAYAWATANPANRKKNWARFLVNWLARSQERAPAVRRGGQTLAERKAELMR